MNQPNPIIKLIVPLLFLAGCKYDKGDFKPHVYLTARGKMSNSMLVNYHTRQGKRQAPPVSQVYYDTVSRAGVTMAYRFKSTHAERNDLEGANRSVHHVELTGLLSNTTYYFKVGDGSTGEEFKFKTLPADPRPLRFVTGGDMGVSLRKLEPILKVAAATDPMVALIGGDIAYANGNRKNTGEWDIWLNAWQRLMVDSQGHMIPLMLAMGNHEVDQLRPIGNPNDRAPFFFNLFSQTADDLSYFARMPRSDILLLVLDSGFTKFPGGKQKKWIIKQFKSNPEARFKIGLYHFPLYPSHRKYNTFESVLARRAWLSTFDKYQLTVGMENHDHTVKRTHTLKNGKIVPPLDGTLYIGDGCFGKSPRTAATDRDYLVKAIGVIHVWSIEVRDDSIYYKAIDSNGKVIDEHIQPVPPLKVPENLWVGGSKRKVGTI